MEETGTTQSRARKILMMAQNVEAKELEQLNPNRAPESDTTTIGCQNNEIQIRPNDERTLTEINKNQDRIMQWLDGVSPSHSIRSTGDCSVADPDYKNSSSSSSSSSSSTSSSSSSSSSSSDNQDTYPNETNNTLLAILDPNEAAADPIPSCSNIPGPPENNNLVTKQDPKRGRKRTKNPSAWKQNKTKKLRNTGQSYKSQSKLGKNIPERTLKPTCNSEKCRLKCPEKINEEARQLILKSFWMLGDITLQRAFLTSCLTEVVPKYKYTNAANPRKPNKAYHFIHDGTKIRVCYVFFKNTLDISDRFIRTANKKTDANGFIERDLRGCHNSHSVISPELKTQIKLHIESIPRIESHYVRADTSREYEIDGSKTIAQLYRDFKTEQLQLNRNPGKYITYYTIFTTEYNIGFHKPKKDQCDDCVAYHNATDDMKPQLQRKFDAHKQETELCRYEKKNDRIKISENTKVAVFDLEAALQCPKGEASSFYYKSKLSCYNFTVVELKKKDEQGKKGTAYEDVHCYFWTEVQGKRGANEIGSCLLDYLKAVNDAATAGMEIIFYSDNCCGQHKNKYIASVFLYAVQIFDKIDKITYKFLIKGHTENEGDNVHSLIEKEITRTLKKGPIYVPHDYISIIKSAKKTPPYFKIHQLDHTFFKDLKTLQEDVGYNFKINGDEGSLVWNDIKLLEFRKDLPFFFFYKTSYDMNEKHLVNVRNSRRKKMNKIEEINVKNAFEEKNELSEIKKKHLKELVTQNIIPRFYADFYETLY